jgi:hypothetical protein
LKNINSFCKEAFGGYFVTNSVNIDVMAGVNNRSNFSVPAMPLIAICMW